MACVKIVMVLLTVYLCWQIKYNQLDFFFFYFANWAITFVDQLKLRLISSSFPIHLFCFTLLNFVDPVTLLVHMLFF